MKKKIDVLRELARNGKWDEAIKLAGTFQQLGNERKAILQAKEAILQPAFQQQIGRSPDKLISAGIAALKNRYEL